MKTRIMTNRNLKIVFVTKNELPPVLINKHIEKVVVVDRAEEEEWTQLIRTTTHLFHFLSAFACSS